jgi:hypothetical protein
LPVAGLYVLVTVTVPSLVFGPFGYVTVLSRPALSYVKLIVLPSGLCTTVGCLSRLTSRLRFSVRGSAVFREAAKLRAQRDTRFLARALSTERIILLKPLAGKSS